MEDEFKGSESEIIALFADFRGFSHMFEVLPAGKIYKFINRYFETAAEIIERYNGNIDNIIGDGLMATWGKKGWSKQSPFYAIRTALEMRMALLRQNVRYKWKSFFPLEIGIGVAMGEAYHCMVGPHNKAIDTVYGKSVILASRLGDLAKNNQIYSGEKIANTIEKWARFKKMPLLNIQGFKTKVHFYNIKGLMDFYRKNSERRKESYIRFIVPEIIAIKSKSNNVRIPVILKNISDSGAGIETVQKEEFVLSKNDEVSLDLKKFSLSGLDTIDGNIVNIKAITEESEEERSLSQIGISFTNVDSKIKKNLEKLNLT